MGGGSVANPVGTGVETKQIPGDFYGTAQKFMPSEYFQNKQINDPSSILNAYGKNMPEFMKAITPTTGTAPVPAEALQDPMSQLTKQIAKLQQYNQRNSYGYRQQY